MVLLRRSWSWIHTVTSYFVLNSWVLFVKYNNYCYYNSNTCVLSSIQENSLIWTHKKFANNMILFKWTSVSWVHNRSVVNLVVSQLRCLLAAHMKLCSHVFVVHRSCSLWILGNWALLEPVTFVLVLIWLCALLCLCVTKGTGCGRGDCLYRTNDCRCSPCRCSSSFYHVIRI